MDEAESSTSGSGRQFNHWSFEEKETLYSFMIAKIEDYKQLTPLPTFYSYMADQMEKCNLLFPLHYHHPLTATDLASTINKLSADVNYRDERLDIILDVHNSQKDTRAKIEDKKLIDFIYDRLEEFEESEEKTLYRFINQKLIGNTEGLAVISVDYLHERVQDIISIKNTMGDEYIKKIQRIQLCIKTIGKKWNLATKKAFVDMLYQKTLAVRKDYYIDLFALAEHELSSTYSILYDRDMEARFDNACKTLIDDDDYKNKIKDIKKFKKETKFMPVRWTDEATKALVSLANKSVESFEGSRKNITLNLLVKLILDQLPAPSIPTSKDGGKLRFRQVYAKLDKLIKNPNILNGQLKKEVEKLATQINSAVP